MSNSVDQNPWQNQPTNGPRFGNAYESEPINSPYGNTYGQTTMPQPGVSSSGYNNAWSHKESNKTEYLNDGTNMQYIPTYPPPQQNSSPYDTSAYSPMPAKQDAYQYSGTAYGNQPQPTGSAYSSVPVVDNPTKPVGPTNQSTTMVTAGPKPWNGEIYHRPSISRLCLRFIILLAGIGHLGFAAGAQPYSGQDVPFYTPAVFYYLFAVAVLSIIYAAYHVLFYCYRRILKKPKMNRLIMIAFDLVMAILWGIGVIIEVAMFRCTNGSRFCSFYNVSIFFGFVAFVGYILAVLWDIFGACRKRK